MHGEMCKPVTKVMWSMDVSNFSYNEGAFIGHYFVILIKFDNRVHIVFSRSLVKSPRLCLHKVSNGY